MVERKIVDIVHFNENGEIKLPEAVRHVIDTDGNFFAVYVETKRGKIKMIWESIEIKNPYFQENKK